MSGPAQSQTDELRGRHAIVLAAGAGSRLSDVEPVKPLAEVDGQPLILHVLHALASAGARGASVVVGHRAAEVEAALAKSPVPARAVFNVDWATAPNGVSLLAAAEDVRPGTFLCMADHLIEPALPQRLVEAATAALSLAVDRRLGHRWVDEADVTRVRTEGRRIRAIGKQLAVYDCYDTGLFLIGPALVAALWSQALPSLSDGVSTLAQQGLAEAIDVGDARWLDVDDARALNLARSRWRG